MVICGNDENCCVIFSHPIAEMGCPSLCYDSIDYQQKMIDIMLPDSMEVMAASPGTIINSNKFLKQQNEV